MLLPISIVRRISAFLSGPATFFDSRADGFRISGAFFPRATSEARLGNVEHTSDVISGVGDRRGLTASRPLRPTRRADVRLRPDPGCDSVNN